MRKFNNQREGSYERGDVRCRDACHRRQARHLGQRHQKKPCIYSSICEKLQYCSAATYSRIQRFTVCCLDRSMQTVRCMRSEMFVLRNACGLTLFQGQLGYFWMFSKIPSLGMCNKSFTVTSDVCFECP